ncbi:MAG: response regulator [bacterium]
MDEKTKILIIDDNRELANSLKDAINAYYDRWEATAVYDGSSVFNLIPTSFPDIVFCDIILPDMSGIEVMKSIKDVEQDIQVIIMTAYASLQTAIEALQYGAFDYIPKPLHMNQIINAIKSAEKRRNSLLENRRMIANLISYKNDNNVSAEAREIIERILLLKHFQKRVSLVENKKTLLESCYNELTRIFHTQFISIFLREDGDKFKVSVSSKIGNFKLGELIDERMPIFYFPLKNGLGCVFPEEKSMTSVIGYENKVIGMIYMKREKNFSQSDLETAEMVSMEIGAKLTEMNLNKKIRAERTGTILALLSIAGFHDAGEKLKIMNTATMASHFAVFLGMSNDDAENLKYCSMLYNMFQSSFGLKFGKKEDFYIKFEELTEELDYLNELKETVMSVGENYDGSGKPSGLKEKQIPEGARILKIISTYCTMSENNKYRAGEMPESILAGMQKNKGIFFDPELLTKFREFMLNEGKVTNEENR